MLISRIFRVSFRVSLFPFRFPRGVSAASMVVLVMGRLVASLSVSLVFSVWFRSSSPFRFLRVAFLCGGIFFFSY